MTARSTSGFIEAAGDAADGAILSCPCYFASEAAEDPAIAEFATAYEEINGTVPGTYSTEAFDAANILLNGILEGNTDRESLLELRRGPHGRSTTPSPRRSSSRRTATSRRRASSSSR